MEMFSHLLHPPSRVLCLCMPQPWSRYRVPTSEKEERATSVKDSLWLHTAESVNQTHTRCIIPLKVSKEWWGIDLHPECVETHIRVVFNNLWGYVQMFEWEAEQIQCGAAVTRWEGEKLWQKPYRSERCIQRASGVNVPEMNMSWWRK